MSEEPLQRDDDEHMGTMCYNEEFKHAIDDCGSMACSLLGITWDEWMGEDACVDCPWAADDYDDYQEAEG